MKSYAKTMHFIDPEVTVIQTAEGKITLKNLFIPMFIEQLLMNMMWTVNTIVMGKYSDEAVVAVGAASQVIGLMYTFYAVVSGGASIVISHRLGAGQEKEAGDAAFTSLFTAGGISLFLSFLLAALSRPIMAAMNLEGEVLDMAETYFRICMGTSFLQGIKATASAILRSYGRPKPAVAVSLFMNGLNAVFNVIIIYRPFEVPFYGAEGIAISNVVSYVIGLILIMILLMRSGLNLQFSRKNLRTLGCIKNILRVGVPGGVSSLSYSLSQVVSTSILAILGTVALSAKIYVSSIVFYVYVIGMSLGLSTAILMGWMAGAKEYDKAYRLNQQVLKLSVTLNLILSTVVFMLHKPLIGLFTNNPDIIAMSGIILFIDIFVEVGRAFNHVEDNSLRGAGDVMFPMVIASISCWMISILFSYILGIRFGLGLAGCWIAFMMDEIFRGLLFFRRFRSGKWKTMKV
jgi:putative MATE family efflux protein